MDSGTRRRLALPALAGDRLIQERTMPHLAGWRACAEPCTAGGRLWLLLSMVAALACPAGVAEEWSRFRGPNGSGAGRAEIPGRWTDADYTWRTTLAGTGHSSPVLWGDRLYVTYADAAGEVRTLAALAAASGEVVWQRSVPLSAGPMHKLNSAASSTPACDAQGVYVCHGSPEAHLVIAYSHEGQLRWRRDLGSYTAGHGFGVSPIVHGELVLVSHEHQGASAVFALDAASGQVRWQHERPSEVVYATGCLFGGGGGLQLVLTSYERGITGLDLTDGSLAWQLDVFDKGHVETSIGSPITADGLVLGVCGWLGVRQEVVAVRPLAGGKVERVWTIDRGAPLCTTPLVQQGLVYLWSDDGIVCCAELASGAEVWRRRVGGTYYGSPVSLGDRLLCVSADGKAVVLAAGREFRLLGRTDLGEASHSTPAVAQGAVFFRTLSQVMRLDGAEAAPQR
ncbi:MAG: PQQ-like beta-propeller repeat protein [Pirellulales bacterium]|nr:PQQ-like beta-propeller repeat protein [Pirellulales bacterium]